ncbi:uncharacterized protein LOC106086448 [Stomoxys calcitrans]|uniref:uncharacterized protein LOC106086448 n=1 Tax=Stomoxys calcitrans TaxID=35570 RepID=UPI0027E2BFD3|nr:uncharacterized protein LOC106086448 [Stomoxys calcitrans]XP_013106585.2 uncharacterized protein LOC106086448 [Stomoxys calcitrans]XP_013106586.2 uncharacterized protein LOC106086448 [Stomoxys calcitrans]
MLKSFKIYTCSNGSLGLHLSRAPWDPYPWVSSIQKDSTSYVAGLRVGDCLLELNGNDVLGLRISEIAALLKNHWLNESSNHVSVVIWRKKAKDAEDDDDEDEDEENNAHNINQQSLQKFATCLQHIAQLLECPVCLEVVKPPGWQCCNGHVLCNNCRSRSEKCPVCRVPLGPRGRCLLSDKLFTLLADSFPCDGVRSNKSSPKDRRKCSTEFHNQPKMAIVSKQRHTTAPQPNGEDDQAEDDDDKSEDFKKIEQDNILLSSLRMGRRRRTKSKKEETETVNPEEGQQENKRPHHSNTVAHKDATVVNVQVKTNNGGSNRKSSQDYRDGVTMRTTTATLLQVPVPAKTTLMTIASQAGNEWLPGRANSLCYCRECFKSDKVANNVLATPTPTTTSNKFLFQAEHHQLSVERRENYQCPTGKLCCLQQNVMPSAANEVAATLDHHQHHHQHHRQQQMTNNKLSTKQIEAAATPTLPIHHAAASPFGCKQLQNEWQILTHLTQDHQMAVNQYYGEFGQRIAIRCEEGEEALPKRVFCLNLRSSGCTAAHTEKFFVAFVPMSPAAVASAATNNSNTTTTTLKVAIFIWHMNPLPQNNDHCMVSNSVAPAGNGHDDVGQVDDEVSNFDAIIENPKTGIKWFGRAHCLTTPWSQIYQRQHFLMHEVMEGQHHPNEDKDADNSSSAHGDGAAFVIVIKSKSKDER